MKVGGQIVMVAVLFLVLIFSVSYAGAAATASKLSQFAKFKVSPNAVVAVHEDEVAQVKATKKPWAITREIQITKEEAAYVKKAYTDLIKDQSTQSVLQQTDETASIKKKPFIIEAVARAPVVTQNQTSYVKKKPFAVEAVKIAPVVAQNQTAQTKGSAPAVTSVEKNIDFGKRTIFVGLDIELFDGSSFGDQDAVKVTFYDADLNALGSVLCDRFREDDDLGSSGYLSCLFEDASLDSLDGIYMALESVSPDSYHVSEYGATIFNGDSTEILDTYRAELESDGCLCTFDHSRDGGECPSYYTNGLSVPLY